ncbi:MAG: hypothetical protein ACK459_15170 [Akkermansiaceae bacterium]|jgi:hypothetical protein
MALCTNACDGKTMVAYTDPNCPEFFKQGNSTSIGYILCEATNNLLKVNYAASGAWATAIAGVDSFKDLNVINNVLISRPEGENITTENQLKGGVPNFKSGESHTVTIIDTAVTTDNHEFYNAIDRKTAYLVIAYNDGRMEVSPRRFMLMVKSPAIEFGVQQKFTIEATSNFNEDQYWLPFDTQPAGIFTFE